LPENAIYTSDGVELPHIHSQSPAWFNHALR
jgi:hypothetical protein